jgi:hypothetical protein
LSGFRVTGVYSSVNFMPVASPRFTRDASDSPTSIFAEPKRIVSECCVLVWYVVKCSPSVNYLKVIGDMINSRFGVVRIERR